MQGIEQQGRVRRGAGDHRCVQLALLLPGLLVRHEAGSDDAATAMRQLATYVRFADLWFTVADARPVDDELLDRARERLYDTFGPWG